MGVSDDFERDQRTSRSVGGSGDPDDGPSGGGASADDGGDEDDDFSGDGGGSLNDDSDDFSRDQQASRSVGGSGDPDDGPSGGGGSADGGDRDEDADSGDRDTLDRISPGGEIPEREPAADVTPATERAKNVDTDSGGSVDDAGSQGGDRVDPETGEFEDDTVDVTDGGGSDESADRSASRRLRDTAASAASSVRDRAARLRDRAGETVDELRERAEQTEQRRAERDAATGTPEAAAGETVPEFDGRKTRLAGPEAGAESAVLDEAGDEGERVSGPQDDPLVPDDGQGLEDRGYGNLGRQEGPLNEAVEEAQAEVGREVPGVNAIDTDLYNVRRSGDGVSVQLTDAGVQARAAAVREQVAADEDVAEDEVDVTTVGTAIGASVDEGSASAAGSGASAGGIGQRPGFGGDVSQPPTFANVGRSPREQSRQREDALDSARDPTLSRAAARRRARSSLREQGLDPDEFDVAAGPNGADVAVASPPGEIPALDPVEQFTDDTLPSAVGDAAAAAGLDDVRQAIGQGATPAAGPRGSSPAAGGQRFAESAFRLGEDVARAPGAALEFGETVATQAPDVLGSPTLAATTGGGTGTDTEAAADVAAAAATRGALAGRAASANPRQFGSDLVVGSALETALVGGAVRAGRAARAGGQSAVGEVSQVRQFARDTRAQGDVIDFDEIRETNSDQVQTSASRTDEGGEIDLTAAAEQDVEFDASGQGDAIDLQAAAAEQRAPDTAQAALTPDVEFPAFGRGAQTARQVGIGASVAAEASLDRQAQRQRQTTIAATAAAQTQQQAQAQVQQQTQAQQQIQQQSQAQQQNQIQQQIQTQAQGQIQQQIQTQLQQQQQTQIQQQIETQTQRQLERQRTESQQEAPQPRRTPRPRVELPEFGRERRDDDDPFGPPAEDVEFQNPIASPGSILF